MWSHPPNPHPQSDVTPQPDSTDSRRPKVRDNQSAIAAYEEGDVSEAISQMERAIADLDRPRELFFETGRSMQHQEVTLNLQNLQNNLQTLQRQQHHSTPTPQQTPPPAPQPDNPGFMF